MCLRQQAAAAAGGGGGGAAAQEPDLATTLAGFPPDVREEVLLTADESVLSRLPPALLAEAQVRPPAHLLLCAPSQPVRLCAAAAWVVDWNAGWSAGWRAGETPLGPGPVSVPADAHAVHMRFEAYKGAQGRL